MSLCRRGAQSAVIVVALLLVVGSLLPVVTIGSATGEGPLRTDGQDLQQQSFDPDGTVMSVDLRQDGSAEWTIQYRLDIRTENETAAFQALREDIRANTSDYVTSFRSRIRATVQEAENTTGRDMRVENFSVQTRTDSLSESGFVTYSFTWHGFAQTDGEQLRAGDALAGLFLDEETTLAITWPEGYDRADVQPAPTATGDRSVSWEGRQSFGVDEPRLVVSPSGIGFLTWLPALAAGIVLFGVVLYLALRSRVGTTRDEASDTPAEEGDADEAPTSVDAEGETGADEGPPPELLSNEERVLQFLDQRGGRVKQQEVVSALDWTEAKTSQVVTDMRDSGDIEVFRIGRENVIKLPDVELEGQGQGSTENSEETEDAEDT